MASNGMARRWSILLGLAVLALGAGAAGAEPVSADQFRQELVGMPLCGTPASGPFAGKPLCTVHLADGTAVVAGSGVLIRGMWELADGKVCRRSPDDPLERRHCIAYERVGEGRYRNSDGVELCLGPCP